MIATEAHGKTRKNKCLKILFPRVLPWLLNKPGAQLNIVLQSLFTTLYGLMGASLRSFTHPTKTNKDEYDCHGSTQKNTEK